MSDWHREAESPVIGSVLADRYRLTGFLGRGGMAEVLRAQDERLHRPVAVKLFRLDAPSDAGTARIEFEIRLLSSLRHPGLVTVYDAGLVTHPSGRTSPFLVMELINGPTLAGRLGGGSMRSCEVAELGRDLAETLDYVHTNNVVHRDVKPANILLDDPGTSVRPFAAKLADFGIARLLEGSRLTTEGMTVGTANYVSPEQIRDEEVTGTSDVYSLGLVLIEALTGRVVYPGVGVEAAIARLHRPPVIPGDVGAGWRRLLIAMTDPEPTHRPSAATVSSELALELTAPVVRRATAVLPAASPNAPTEPGLRKNAKAQDPSDIRRSRSRMRIIVALAAVVVAAVTSSILLFGRGSDSRTSTPRYPSVPGQLGRDLTELQQTVE